MQAIIRSSPMSKKISLDSAKLVTGSRYPVPFDKPCEKRLRRRLGDVAGLTQFGVNLTRLPAGAWSSQRHWHTAEDEFIYILEGEAVLVTDSGEEVLRAGDCAGFKAGDADGHHLQNRTDRDVLVLEVGSRRSDVDEAYYPGIDLKVPKGGAGFTHANGEPYASAKPLHSEGDVQPARLPG
jgi:uncharacterized cupin superfamily protein